MNTIGKLHEIGAQQEIPQAILDLDQLAFPWPWNAQQWQELVRDHHWLVTWSIQDQLRGFALFSWIKDDDTAHLLKICLHPECQGRGEGQAFWKEILNTCKLRQLSSIFLEVAASNEQALKFYQSAGFKELRRVKGFYSDGATGVMMLLTL